MCVCVCVCGRLKKLQLIKSQLRELYTKCLKWFCMESNCPGSGSADERVLITLHCCTRVCDSEHVHVRTLV